MPSRTRIALPALSAVFALALAVLSTPTNAYG